MEKKTWIAEVQEDPNNPEELILTFPQEMLEELGWKEGDILEWNETEVNAFVIHNKTKDGSK